VPPYTLDHMCLSVCIWLSGCCLRNRELNKKLSYRWQTAWRLCTTMLRSLWHKTLRNIAFHAVLSRATLWRMTVIYWPDFLTFTYPSPIWRPQWRRSPWAVRFIFFVGKLEWLGYNLVTVAQCLSTNRLTDRQPSRHSKCRANALRRAAKI